MKSATLATLAISAALVLGCSRGTAGENDTTAKTGTGEPCDNWVSGAEARKTVAEGGLLLDVRTEDEFLSGHLDGAKNINVEELPDRMDEIPKDQHVVVYCRSGKRAQRAAEMLKNSGYSVSEIGTQAQYAPDSPEGCGGS